MMSFEIGVEVPGIYLKEPLILPKQSQTLILSHDAFG
jgi:hypothetical protein